MYCEKCGTQNKEGTLFCKNCGFPMNQKVPKQSSTPESYTDEEDEERTVLQDVSFQQMKPFSDAGNMQNYTDVKAQRRQPRKLFPQKENQESPKLAMFVVYDLLFLIPFVNLVLAIVLMISGETKTIRTYAKAALMILLVCVVLFLLVFKIPGCLEAVKSVVHAVVNYLDHIL